MKARNTEREGSSVCLCAFFFSSFCISLGSSGQSSKYGGWNASCCTVYFDEVVTLFHSIAMSSNSDFSVEVTVECVMYSKLSMSNYVSDERKCHWILTRAVYFYCLCAPEIAQVLQLKCF